MKTLRIILSLILATTIFACEDKNIFPDPMTLPVKALDLNVEIMDIFSLPDDRAAAFVKLDKQSTDTKDAYQLAIIDKHGNYTLSDVMYVFSLDEEQFADKQIYISSSGDIFVKFQVREIAASNIVKLNKDGHIIYSNDNKGIRRETDYIYSYYLYSMYDNGEIAVLRSNIFNDNESPSVYYFLEIIDNQGNPKNIAYFIDRDYYWTNIIPFEDKFFLYNSYMGINGYYYDNDIELSNPDFGYCILNADGTTVKLDKLNIPIYDVKYVDGNIYFTSLLGAVETDDEDGSFIAQWCITKMDTSGEVVIQSEIIQASYLSPNITVQDGTMIVPGLVATDVANDEGFGVIYLLDDNTGKLNDSIALHYNNVDVIPSVIIPDSNGEYDVFSLVRHDYDDWNDFKNDGNMENGKLYIYHTDDLHKFNVNN